MTSTTSYLIKSSQPTSIFAALFAWDFDQNSVGGIHKMKHRLMLLLACCLCVLFYASVSWAQMPAFPGAQGGGAVSVGGRGGAVIMVTNLNDSGAGSLRACVTASGPRTCVFRVGGRIDLTSQLYVANPFLTVAGQTSPGDGILITGPRSEQNIVAFETHDVIWRYTRLAHGYNEALHQRFLATGDSPGANLTMYENTYNIMFDHNSTWWNMDEGLAWGGNSAGRITFSWNIVAEGLATHSTGYLFSGDNNSATANFDLHHNLTMNNSHRNPKVDLTGFRAVNNITYNNRLHVVQLAGGNNTADFIENIYKRGPMNIQGNPREFYFAGQKSVYLLRNRGFNQTNPNGDQWIMTSSGTGGNGPVTAAPAPAGWQRFTPQAAQTFPIGPDPVETLESTMLPLVGDSRRLDCNGNWVTIRNSVDTRLVNQYQTNTGITSRIINENQVGGFPATNGGTPCADADFDGMPDVWEVTRGLNPNNPADRNLDQDGDGWTNLEEYLNGSVSSGDTTPPRPPSGLTIS